MDLTPSDGVLLAGEHFAPRGWYDLFSAELDNGFAYAIGGFFAIALASGLSGSGYDPRISWSLGGAAAVACLGTFVWKRFVRPERAILGRIDESKLERTLHAAALLANERQGLLSLKPDGLALLAEPTGATPSWPAESLEQSLLPGRTVSVSELVSDWRAAYPRPVAQLSTAAARREILCANPSRSGPLWIPSAAALTAFDSGRIAALLDNCRLKRPEVWGALKTEIETGTRRQAAAPNLRFEDGAMADSIPVAELEERKAIFRVPKDAVVLQGGVSATTIWLPIVALYAFLPHPPISWAPSYYALALAFATGAAVLASQRAPQPPSSSDVKSDEETALARERLRPPPALRERLTQAAVPAGIVCCLGLAACSFPPVGPFLFTVVMVGLGVVVLRKIRLARLPSAREVELAVARRSRELTAAHAVEPDVDDELASSAAPAAGDMPRRPLLETNARDLPPPTAPALARADQRRRAALFMLRRHWTAFVLLFAGQAILSVVVWRLMGFDPVLLFPFSAIVPVGCLLVVAREALKARYRLRPVALRRDGSISSRILGRTAKVMLMPFGSEGAIPDLGRTLQDLLAAEPEFWRDETFDLDSPLGLAPTVCLAFWLLFVPIAFLLAPIAHAGFSGTVVLEVLAFTAGGLALAAWYVIYKRSARAALGQKVKFAPGVRLLMLRVFGSPSFDELMSLVKPWLLVGPIGHLEGYDSIIRSQEAREKLADGRLDDVLIKSPEDLTREMRNLESASGTVLEDFRFRRCKFQCTDFIWKEAIRALLERSDVVVMDLSNLKPANLGCAYELGLLLNRVKLSRVLLLVSDTTNRDCLQTILADAETRLGADSPNRDHLGQPWRLLRIGGPTAQQPQESYLDWVRRLDNRLEPMQLVSYLLDLALTANVEAKTTR